MQAHLLEKALLVIKSEQYLVNMISRRVRQLTSGHRPMVEVGPRMGFADIALTEVIELKLSYEATPSYVEEPIAPRRQGPSDGIGDKRAAA
jgi:DNA-directed RNA polymerase subunit omega